MSDSLVFRDLLLFVYSFILTSEIYPQNSIAKRMKIVMQFPGIYELKDTFGHNTI